MGILILIKPVPKFSLFSVGTNKLMQHYEHYDQTYVLEFGLVKDFLIDLQLSFKNSVCSVELKRLLPSR